MNSKISEGNNFKLVHYVIIFISFPLCLLLFGVGCGLIAVLNDEGPFIKPIILYVISGGVIAFLSAFFFTIQVINIYKFYSQGLEKTCWQILIFLIVVIMWLFILDKYFAPLVI